MSENFDPIWHNPPTNVDLQPMPFEFKWEVYDKTGEEIKVTVSGFYVYEDIYHIHELKILDGVKNNITPQYNDGDTVREIEEYLKENVL